MQEKEDEDTQKNVPRTNTERHGRNDDSANKNQTFVDGAWQRSPPLISRQPCSTAARYSKLSTPQTATPPPENPTPPKPDQPQTTNH
jgi:hypothetical protein